MKGVFIKQPCYQSWEGMEMTEEGNGYCDKCKETVYDFSDAPPEIILDKYRELKGNLCIRVFEDQVSVKRSRFTLILNKRAPVRSLVLSLLAFFGLGSASIAQSNGKPTISEPVEQR